MMGPTEQMPTMPKLSSCEREPPTAPEMPTPSARMKGTVMGPVVTPPESNERGTYPSAEQAASTKTTA